MAFGTPGSSPGVEGFPCVSLPSPLDQLRSSQVPSWDYLHSLLADLLAPVPAAMDPPWWHRRGDPSQAGASLSLPEKPLVAPSGRGRNSPRCPRPQRGILVLAATSLHLYLTPCETRTRCRPPPWSAPCPTLQGLLQTPPLQESLSSLSQLDSIFSPLNSQGPRPSSLSRTGCTLLFILVVSYPPREIGSSLRAGTVGPPSSLSPA